MTQNRNVLEMFKAVAARVDKRDFPNVTETSVITELGIDRVFAEVQKMAPTLRDVYVARGELALEKHDFGLAAKAFEDGLKQTVEWYRSSMTTA